MGGQSSFLHAYVFVLFCFVFVMYSAWAPRWALPSPMGLAPPVGPCPPRWALSVLGLPDGPCQRPVPGLPDGPCPPRWALPAACAWAPRWALPPTDLLALPGLPDGPARLRGALAARARGWRRLCRPLCGSLTEGNQCTVYSAFAVTQASVWQASVWRALGGAAYYIYYYC